MSAVEDRLAEIEAWGHELGDASSGPVEQFEAAEHISALAAALRAVLAECEGQTRASTARITDAIAAHLVVTP